MLSLRASGMLTSASASDAAWASACLSQSCPIVLGTVPPPAATTGRV